MIYRFSNRSRVYVLMSVCTCYILCLALDALVFFSHQNTTSLSSLGTPVLTFLVSALISILFLAVGLLVWLYARQRQVAQTLFAFCTAISLSFAVQTGAELGDPFLSAIGSGTAVIAIVLLAFLMLLFPHNYLHWMSRTGRQKYSSIMTGGPQRSGLIVRLYVLLLVIFACAALLTAVSKYIPDFPLPGWFIHLFDAFYLLALSGTLVTVIYGYTHSASKREKPQLLFFGGGVIISIAPLLVLTILPELLGLPSTYIVPGVYSTLSLIFLPLALGYMVLRYQFIVVERYIQWIVTGIIAIVGFTILGYGVFVLNMTIIHNNFPVLLLSMIMSIAVVGSLVWWVALFLAQRLLAFDADSFKRFPGNHQLSQASSITNTAQTIAETVRQSCESREVFLYVLDEQSRSYQPRAHVCLEPFQDQHTGVSAFLFEHAGTFIQTVGNGWIKQEAPIIAWLAQSHFPRKVSELHKDRFESTPVLSRVFATSLSNRGRDPLLAPLSVGDAIQGFVLLDERVDGQSYAGPDYEHLVRLLQYFSPQLEKARHDADMQKSLHQHITMYTQMMPGQTFETDLDVARAYAHIAVDTSIEDLPMTATVEIWIAQDNGRLLTRRLREGELSLTSENMLKITHLVEPWFYTPEDQQAQPAQVPACLQTLPSCPTAWLPLKGVSHLLGVLVLLYPYPHHFLDEDRRMLELIAEQCATAIENMRDIRQLLALQERFVRNTHLCEQYISVALRSVHMTLTNLQGYLDVLLSYRQTISADVRNQALGNAEHLCMDAHRELERMMRLGELFSASQEVNLVSTDLAAVIQQSITGERETWRREKRTIQVDIPANVFVAVDVERLQLVLGEILSAILHHWRGKDEPIRVTCQVKDVEVIVRIGVELQQKSDAIEEHTSYDLGAVHGQNSQILDAQHPLEGLRFAVNQQIIADIGGNLQVTVTQPSEEYKVTLCLRRVASTTVTSTVVPSPYALTVCEEASNNV